MLDQRWIHRGEAIALAASIDSPFQDTLALGSGLPGIGGATRHEFPASQWHDIIKYDRASCSVESSVEKSCKYETVVSASIEGLSIAGVLHIDRIDAQAAGRFHSDWTGSAGRDHACLYPVKCDLSGFRIDGASMDVESDPEFADCCSKLSWDLDLDTDNRIRSLEQGNPVRSVAVPGLGTVYFRQWLVRKNDAEFSMLRLKLDGSLSGSLLSVSLRVGGHWYP